MSRTEKMTVHCPTCGQTVCWEPAQRYRPFCSERCKTLDFGGWAAEKHRIPGEPVAEEDLLEGLSESDSR